MVAAVGSGVVNDLCKWASFKTEVPYCVVATAASMNGYAAANVAAKVDGVKVLVRARCPVAVVAEPGVIEGAPSAMTAAGFGDAIAKPFSTADWQINNLLLDEYYCQRCADMLSGMVEKLVSKRSGIREGDKTSIQFLFEVLFWQGAAMTLVGSSAPASGGEHLLSHTLDMFSDAKGWDHDLHGRQVGLGVVLAAGLYERVFDVDEPALVCLPAEIDSGFWGGGKISEAVARQYSDKRESIEVMRGKLACLGCWEIVKERVNIGCRRRRSGSMCAGGGHRSGSVMGMTRAIRT